MWLMIMILICRLGPPSRSESETQIKQKEILMVGSGQRTEKAVKHDGDSVTNCNWCTGTNPQKDWKID